MAMETLAQVSLSHDGTIWISKCNLLDLLVCLCPVLERRGPRTRTLVSVSVSDNLLFPSVRSKLIFDKYAQQLQNSAE